MNKRFVWATITALLILPALIACGSNKEESTPNTQPATPVQQAEVVAFATQPPNTPTPPPPTNTPLPTPKPITATPTQSPTQIPTPTPTPGLTRAQNENPLTGLVVDPAVFQHRPLHIRIGNDTGARPQINLNLADVVYEEIVEWWITRFTAVFYTNAPDMVAPIRSARLINTQLTGQYDAALINSGGSDPVRWELSQLPIVNLDEFFHPEPYFYRENEGWQRRLAVNPAEAHTYMEEEGLQSAVELRGFAFDAAIPADADPATTIFVDYPSKDSKVLWTFNPAENRYERSTAGEAMIDGATDEVMNTDNVIIYFAPHYETDIVEDSTGATSVGININGEGDAWIFRDGVVIKGQWQTDGTQTPEFTNAEGKPIPLHPGRTWIEVVPLDYEILIDTVPNTD